jgi:hypothetical protein
MSSKILKKTLVGLVAAALLLAAGVAAGLCGQGSGRWRRMTGRPKMDKTRAPFCTGTTR